MNFVSLLATCSHLTSSSERLQPGTVQNTLLVVISQQHARRVDKQLAGKSLSHMQSLGYQGKSCPKYDNCPKYDTDNYFIIYK